MITVKGFVDAADRISNYTNRVDLFIGAIGQEERSTRGLNILKAKGIKVSSKLILYFNEALSATSDQDKEEERYDRMFDMTSIDNKLHVDLYNEIDGSIAFKKKLMDYLKNGQETIVLDISVIMSPYIFLMLRHMSLLNLENIYVLYTEPISYRNLTKGTSTSKDVPGFSGAKQKKKDALVIILGFEGNRAVEVLHEVSTDLTIPVNGFPSFKPDFKDKSIMENRELLSEDDILKNLCYAPANDPFETKNCLESIYAEYGSKYNISIVPLGSKPMTLGSCLFALEHSDCRIIYPYPKEYYPKPSQGSGKSWLYYIKLLKSPS